MDMQTVVIAGVVGAIGAVIGAMIALAVSGRRANDPAAVNVPNLDNVPGAIEQAVGHGQNDIAAGHQANLMVE